MAYYFMSEVSKGKYRELNISNSKYFQDINRRYNKPCAYTLEEIDKFTMMFDNEIELRERLVEEGILPLSLFEKPLSIRTVQKNEYSKVPYNFLYQNDIEYIMDPSRLIEKIIKRFYGHDFLLIKKIVSRFDGDHYCKSTLPEVRQHLEASIREGQINKHFFDLDENNNQLLPRLLKLLILESYSTKSGKTIYKDKVRYRNLHTLIALINYYDQEEQITDKKTSSTNSVELEKQEAPTFKSNDDELKKGIAPKFTEVCPSKEPIREYRFVKKRTIGKKKHTLDEQIGFDI